MSLFFVSKTIQTGRDDGGYDEKPVEASENSGGDQSSYTAAQKPLFEQLREKQEQEEEEREELQRSMMRGTLALDEEDCAHLDYVNKHRMQEQSKRQQQTEQELTAFRAAQADRLEKQESSQDTALTKGDTGLRRDVPEKRTGPSLVAPRILVKKRRLRVASGDSGEGKQIQQNDETQTSASTSKTIQTSSGENAAFTAAEPKPGLGGLLSGYGSSDDEEY
jgi:hypothetical protein